MAWIFFCVSCNQAVCFTGSHISLVSCSSWYQICISWRELGNSNSASRRYWVVVFAVYQKRIDSPHHVQSVCVPRRVYNVLPSGIKCLSLVRQHWYGRAGWWATSSMLGSPGGLLLPNWLSMDCLVIMYLKFSRSFSKSVLQHWYRKMSCSPQYFLKTWSPVPSFKTRSPLHNVSVCKGMSWVSFSSLPGGV